MRVRGVEGESATLPADKKVGRWDAERVRGIEGKKV